MLHFIWVPLIKFQLFKTLFRSNSTQVHFNPLRDRHPSPQLRPLPILFIRPPSKVTHLFTAVFWDMTLTSSVTDRLKRRYISTTQHGVIFQNTAILIRMSFNIPVYPLAPHRFKNIPRWRHEPFVNEPEAVLIHPFSTRMTYQNKEVGSPELSVWKECLLIFVPRIYLDSCRDKYTACPSPFTLTFC
jgi:hypothetical protein